ncbi:MAG: M15 family metallopeptidase [Oscillospiraceae bacterium]|jgi:D-alanyl-D-alanine carboxypeptidase|nr:M15 family metallopeptidase [Oscillospiraceae bacterium]
MSQKRLLLMNLCILIIATVAFSLTVIFAHTPDVEDGFCIIPQEESHIHFYWAYSLINDDNPLPADYLPELEVIDFTNSREFYLDSRAAPYATAMLAAAESDGVALRVVSAFRSQQRQLENFNNYVERLINEHGISVEEATILTASQIAQPGASEHNAGVAVDILNADWFLYNNDVTEEFERTPEFRWLAENSWKYGFILRYPQGKEEVTGFIYEPWHFRYVGIDVAEQIKNSGLTLEEYIDLYPPIQQFQFKRIR